jgi:hypothetical protein
MLRISRFVRETSGAIAVLVTLLIPIMLGLVALGTEIALLRVKDSQLQVAADAAVFAAAIERGMSGSSITTVSDEARSAAVSVFGPLNGAPYVEYPSTSRTKVTLEAAISLRLLPLWTGPGGHIISKSAIVDIQVATMPTCLQSLASNLEDSLHFTSSSSRIRLVNCNFHSGSTNNTKGLHVERNVEAYCASYAATRFTRSSSATITLDPRCSASSPPQPVPSTTLSDPFQGVTIPWIATSGSSSLQTLNGRTTRVFEPGRYTGSIDISSNDILFKPGVYRFENSTFKIGTEGRVSGDGVTIFYLGNSMMELSKADFRLTAPDSGAYQDLLIFACRTSSSGLTSTNGTNCPNTSSWSNRFKIFDINSNSTFRGSFYFRNDSALIDGNITISSGCAKFIARRLQFAGNTSITVNCSGVGVNLVLVE